MNFFKRAIASVTRKKGKTFILFAVIFVLGNVIAGAISIQQATKSVEKTIKSQLGGTASIVGDNKEIEKYYNATPDGEEAKDYVDLKVIKKIGALPYVKYYDYSMTDYIGSKKFKNYAPPEEEGGTVVVNGDMVPYYTNFKGVNYAKVLDITSKKIELVEGRVFTEEEIKKGKSVVLISKQLAQANHLSVGDRMVVDRSQEEYQEVAEGEEPSKESDKKVVTKEYAYEVIGLFTPVKKEEKKDANKNSQANMMNQSMEYEQANTVYAPNEMVKKDQDSFNKEYEAQIPNSSEEEEGIIDFQSYTPTFVLKSADDSEAFREEATALLPNKYTKILMSTDQFDSVAGPVKGMSKVAGYVLYIAIGATLLIITLVILLFLRDRKHELGIYLSFGEKRGKVIGQIVIEVMMIAIVAITLSVFTGNFLAKGISSSMVESQLASQSESDKGMDYDFYELMNLTNNPVDESDVSNAFEVTLTPQYILVFYVVGLGTILLSTIVPLVYIMRLNPKKIMM